MLIFGTQSKDTEFAKAAELKKSKHCLNMIYRLMEYPLANGLLSEGIHTLLICPIQI